jgi:hypothetical protein
MTHRLEIAQARDGAMSESKPNAATGWMIKSTTARTGGQRLWFVAAFARAEDALDAVRKYPGVGGDEIAVLRALSKEELVGLRLKDREILPYFNI